MAHQFELRQLRYFLTVAEELHFRRAAEKLFIAQPGLSRQIKELEKEIGLTLFERNNRSVKLTPAGLYLKEEVKRILKEMNHSVEHAKLLHDGLQGNLKFGYVGSAMQKIIPELLLKLGKAHPKMVINLKEMDNQKQLQDLIAKDIDIGFVRIERIPKGLKAKAVIKENFCLVLPEDHDLTARKFKSIQQLEQESFILFDPAYSSSYYEKVMQIFDDHGFSPIVTHNTIHASSIYKLVQHKLGISIVPKSLQSNRVEGVRFVELKNIPQKTTLSAVWNTQNRNPMLDHVIQLLKAY